MLFNSFDFLIFFPVVTCLFFLLPHRLRWLLLLVASCIFYMYFIPIYMVILAGTIVVDYFAGIMIEQSHARKRRLYLILSLIPNIGVLAVFKYYNFFISNFNELGLNLPLLRILLPIGLSFHTFQAMSYTIEVYRGNQKAERHFGIYALYVMFYPQLVAGPIERPQNVLPQFHEEKKFNYDDAVAGLRLIMWGMLKKVVIADRLATFTDPVFNHPATYPGLTIAIAVVFFSFQIFCDFSGYSDIALGTARVMGFRLMTNFNKPYHSRSISEFWKRWHISLSTWFKDYLYIPLGGNRVSVPRAYFNLFIVFLVSGFWHGANWTFIIWGALHGFYLIITLITIKLKMHFRIKSYRTSNFINVLVVFSLVTFAWIFFRANTVADAFLVVRKLEEAPANLITLFQTANTAFLLFPIALKHVLLSFLLIGFLEVCHIIQLKKHFMERFERLPVVLRWTTYYACIAFIIYFGVFEQKSFIYFQF